MPNGIDLSPCRPRTGALARRTTCCTSLTPFAEKQAVTLAQVGRVDRASVPEDGSIVAKADELVLIIQRIARKLG